MKKLLALILGIVVALIFSMVTFAAPGELLGTPTGSGPEISSITFNPDNDGVDVGKFVVTVTGLTADAQTTLLAHEDASFDVATESGKIQYIDQAANSAGVATFEFYMKETPVAGKGYTIKVGAADMGTALSEFVTPIQGSDEVVISGTLEGIPTSSDYDSVVELLEIYFDGEDEVIQECIELYTTAFATRIYFLYGDDIFDIATLFAEVDLEAYDIESSSIVKTVAEFSESEFSLSLPSGLENGRYWLAVARNGFATYLRAVSYVDGVVTMDDSSIELIAGDVDCDYSVTSYDLGILFSNLSYIGSDRYTTFADFDYDGVGSSYDVSHVLAGVSKVPYSEEYDLLGIYLDGEY